MIAQIFTCSELLNRLMSPENHINKVYEVLLKHDLCGNETELFQHGIQLKERGGERFVQCKPAVFVPTSSRGGQITLVEGKYHQIRRMFAALGNRVTELHRIQIGNIHISSSYLKDKCSAEGGFCLLKDCEIKRLWNHNLNTN